MSARRRFSISQRCAVFAVMSLVNAAAAGADLQQGRLLYEQNCTECHYSALHDRGAKLAQSLDEITFQVRRWASYKKLEWSREEIEAVTRYLNGEFYKYESRAAGS